MSNTNPKTYTQKEVQSNINTLTGKMESLKLSRTETTQNINSIKKTNRGMEKLRH